MNARGAQLAAATLALALIGSTGCIAPEDRRPGLWLTGGEAEFPSDWSFSDAYPEVALEVRAPYFLPHSVTIWCVSVEGTLYIAARDPESKRWPGWVEDEDEIRVAMGGIVYEGRLVRLSAAEAIDPVRRAYATKYELPDTPPGEGPPMRYWRVAPRS